MPLEFSGCSYRLRARRRPMSGNLMRAAGRARPPSGSAVLREMRLSPAESYSSYSREIVTVSRRTGAPGFSRHRILGLDGTFSVSSRSYAERCNAGMSRADSQARCFLTAGDVCDLRVGPTPQRTPDLGPDGGQTLSPLSIVLPGCTVLLLLLLRATSMHYYVGQGNPAAPAKRKSHSGGFP